MRKEDSQNMQILRYLKTHKRGLTQAMAVDLFGCYRLSARIKNLRDDNYDIETYLEDNKNKPGQHARYFLREDDAR